MITIESNGQTTTYATAAIALEEGATLAQLAPALKTAAKVSIKTEAAHYRGQLVSISAGKLAEYRIKEEIARDPASASDIELALIDREAAARGIDRDALIALINTKTAAYRQTALLIGALEAEAGAAITAIPDDAADIETQIHTVLGAAKAQAEAAFVEAVALINGGS